MTLIQPARILVGDDQVLTGHAVLIKGDRIADVAPLDSFAGYAGPRMDASDKTLMPGLIDCHVHLCSSGSADPHSDRRKQTEAMVTLLAVHNAQKTLAAGITAVRDCGGMDYIEIALRNAINAGQLSGPIIRASGKMICMTGGHGHAWGREADGEAEVTKAVREQIRAGCDNVKLMATGGVMTPGVNPEDAHFSLEEMTAGVSEAKRFRKTTASHAQGTAGIINAVKAGIDSVEHGIWMPDEVIQMILEAGTYVVPTLAAVKNIVDNKDNGVPPYAVEKSLRAMDAHSDSIRRFHQAGGKIAMGTDAGTPFNRHGANRQELALLVDHGMTPLQAITAATRNAADLLAILEEVGTVTAGKRADLVLAAGDPTQDITLLSDPAAQLTVFKDGLTVH